MVERKLGQYRLLEHLATGGMGSVYRAIDETLDREVAIKLFDADFDDPERFRIEATTIARFNHPGIATVYELFQDEHWVMVMEFIRGETLQQQVDRLGCLTPEHAADVCMQALTALAYSHQMGVIHRDLKPSNLMITTSGVVKIMDFGVAMVMGSVHRTQAGFTMGTPAYMAPEQVKGERLDPRTDLYAMGIILFRLLTGRLPFDGKTAFAIAHSHVSETPQSVRLLNPKLPEWTERILARALAKSPDDRFQSADEFRQALRLSLTHALPHAVHENPEATERVDVMASHPRPTRDVATWPSLVVAALVVGVIGTSLSWRTSVRHVDPPAAGQLVVSALPVSAYGSLLPALTGLVPAPPPTASSEAVATKAKSAAAEAAPEPVSETVSGAAVDAVPSAFGKVKLFTANAERSANRDVVLHLSTDSLTLLPHDGGPPILTFPYRQIRQATYAHARDPRWEPSLGSPAVKFSDAGLFSRARHWLVVQTKENGAILQLDPEHWSKIVATFERRTGLTVTRSTDGKN
jgi:serine/threonine-protein kinase